MHTLLKFLNEKPDQQKCFPNAVGIIYVTFHDREEKEVLLNIIYVTFHDLERERGSS